MLCHSSVCLHVVHLLPWCRLLSAPLLHELRGAATEGKGREGLASAALKEGSLYLSLSPAPLPHAGRQADVCFDTSSLDIPPFFQPAAVCLYVSRFLFR